MCGPVAIDDLSLKVGGDNRLAHGLKQAGLEAQLLHLLFCHDMHLHYSAKQNRPPPFAVVAGCATGSTRPRHPSMGASFSASIQQLGFVYTQHTCAVKPRATLRTR